MTEYRVRYIDSEGGEGVCVVGINPPFTDRDIGQLIKEALANDGIYVRWVQVLRVEKV